VTLSRVEHCKEHDRFYERVCPDCRAKRNWDIVCMVVIGISVLAFFASSVLQSAKFWEMP
jgi:hypothetical protein